MKIYDFLKNNQGGNILNGKIVNYENGYMVAIGNLAILSDDDFKNKVDDYVKMSKKYNIGFWFDSNQWYVDISKNYKYKANALKQAKKLNELAIWDCQKFQSIYL